MFILVITVCGFAALRQPFSDVFQAVNDEGGNINQAFDHDHNVSGTIPEIAKGFKAKRQPWALIVDDNYGEGSAREHAALQPRFYGRWRRLLKTVVSVDQPHRMRYDCGPILRSHSRDKSKSLLSFPCRVGPN